MITYKPAIYQSNPYLLKMRLFLIVEGYLEYPYLILAGFYKQMWDWDGFYGKLFYKYGSISY